MVIKLGNDEVFGFLRPGVDAHTLGISYVESLLVDQGCRVVVADADICDAANHPSSMENAARLTAWLRANRITRIGFSFRLDPLDGVGRFERLMYQLDVRQLLNRSGGPIRAVYFAGLPRACEEVQRRFSGQVEVFFGDETATETLEKLGVPLSGVQGNIAAESEYDGFRIQFARDLLRLEKHLAVVPPARSGYPEFGTRQDHVVARIQHARKLQQPPLMRAHVGPFGPDRAAAVALFLSWARELAGSGFLDVLSIGTSQLSQSHFEMDWHGLPNGGGVPIQNRNELADVWNAARPMLVRTYAGTRDVPRLARVYEDVLSNAWTAMSFWWFCLIDGRGPNAVLPNLREHLETLSLLAEWNKPFEPNIPHHFAFRGADDLTYVVSAVLAARAASLRGVKHMILQLMLNTPRFTWGIQDLAKARATIRLVREFAGPELRVFIQPRAGLDYLSHDLEKAKAQLAAVTALMDDIEPNDPGSPSIVHVVSYSEGSHLATPDIVDDSIRITQAAIAEYRRLRALGDVPDMVRAVEVEGRTQALVRDGRRLLLEMARAIPDLHGAEGLYRAFADGYLIAPYLWEGREEFGSAVDWKTRILAGSVRVVDARGEPIAIESRIDRINQLRALKGRSDDAYV